MRHPNVRAAAKKPDWGPWEDRSHVRNDPRAPVGLARAFINAIYSVQEFVHDTEYGEIRQLMVRRHDCAPIRSWSDMQRVKDEIAGRDRVAVEVYPRAADVHDVANIYHLWVFPEGFTLPFSLGAMSATVRLPGGRP